MDVEDKATELIDDWRKDLEDEKGVDKAKLAIAAMDEAERQYGHPKSHKWLYIISAGAPPAGLLIGAWLFFSGKPGDRRVAIWCAVLTVISLGIAWAIGASLSSSLGPSVNAGDIENVNVSEIRDLIR
jgi:hypothetical protein